MKSPVSSPEWPRVSPAFPAKGGDHSSESMGIPDEVWAKLSRDATPVDCEPGECLFWQGDGPDRVYFLLAGRVKLTRNENGRELIIGLRVPGSFLGAAAALLGYDHPFSAHALSTCRLVVVRAESFRRIAAADHGFCLHLLRSQLREMSEDLDNASGVGCLTVRQRLEGFLWKLTSSTRAGTEGPLRLELPLRHWEVAQFLAITPEHLSRVLKELEEEGLVQRRRGWLILPDPARLAPSSSSVEEGRQPTAQEAPPLRSRGTLSPGLAPEPTPCWPLMQIKA